MADPSCPQDQQTESDLELLGRETAFQGFFRVERLRVRHRDAEGNWTAPYVREVFERGHAVAVLPFDPGADRVVLIEQLRVPPLLADAPTWQTEVPAGIIEAGETPEAVAARELTEESGLSALALHRLFRFLPSPGGSSETITLYLALVDSRQASARAGLSSEQEEIHVRVLATAEAFRLAEDGRIENASALLALQWLQLHRDDPRLAGPLPPPGTDR